MNGNRLELYKDELVRTGQLDQAPEQKGAFSRLKDKVLRRQPDTSQATAPGSSGQRHYAKTGEELEAMGKQAAGSAPPVVSRSQDPPQHEEQQPDKSYAVLTLPAQRIAVWTKDLQKSVDTLRSLRVQIDGVEFVEEKQSNQL